MYTFPKNFIDAIKSKDCIFFIGSGVSIWSNLPSWYQLINDMLQFLCDKGLSNEEFSEIKSVLAQGDLLSAANLCLSCMRNEDFQIFVDNEFRKEFKIHEIHKIIVDLGIDSFITTNYDKLIEIAYLKHNDINLHLINNNQPSEHAKIVKAGSSHFIFKPHGDVDNSETIILSTRDYRKIKYELQSVITTMEHLMISRPIVYLGFGLKDPDFLMIKDRISSTYKGGEREHFAVLPDVGKLYKNYLREEYGINVIPYDITFKEIIDGNGKRRKVESHEKFIDLLKDLHSIIHGVTTSKSIESTQPEISFVSYLKNGIVRYCEEIKHKALQVEDYIFNLNVNINKELSKDFKDNTSKEKWILTNSFRNADIYEVLDRVESMIIIGPPGSGKTHSIKRYSTSLADRTSSIFNNAQIVSNVELKHSIPIILPMKEYNGDIIKMIIGRLPRSIDIEMALKCEYLVLFFDAIDEISREFTDNNIFVNDIENFLNEYSGNRFIFTSRALTYMPSIKLPVFDINPLDIENKDFIAFLKDNFSVSEEQMTTQVKSILKNPFFLSLFSKVNKDKRGNVFNIVSLLEEYLVQINNRFAEETGITDLPVQRVLGPICFETINKGMKTIPLELMVESSRKIFVSYSYIADKVPNILISMGILVLDSEGSLGFIHQTVLEYLAALQLAEIYMTNPSILEEKITFFNWDETIMIFLNLISKDNISRVLWKVVEKDINFACKAFNFSAIKTEELGMDLFNFIYDKANDATTLVAEKKKLANSMMFLIPYGDTEKLMQLLDNKEISEEAALFLAHLNAKESIPKIIKLLLEDNKWPSNFAKALIDYEDERIALKLLNAVKEIDDDGLVINNIADVIAEYESDRIYQEITPFISSNKARDRKLIVEVLEKIDSEYSNRILEAMLDDSDPNIIWRIIFCFRGKGGRQSKKNSNIVSKMFNLLKNKNSGHYAAEYLYKMFDDSIHKEALRKLINCQDNNEKINLYHVIANKEQEIVEKELISFLNNYDSTLHDSLSSALSCLDINKVFGVIYEYLKSEDSLLRYTILETISSGLGFNTLLDINEEQCEYLIKLWENANHYSERQAIRIILTENCSYISKNLVVTRFNNPEYALRYELVDVVVRYPLSKEDFTNESIEWLIANIGGKNSHWNPITHILGKVCCEELVKEQLIPLLHSDNESIRNSAYDAISYSQRRLGRRLI